MTYRDRRAARAERLREWASKREAKSAQSFARVDAIADNIPMGQPILVGHHSEGRARRDQDRIISGMQAGIEHQAKAASMRSRADNIEAAADHAIYSDDPDAIEQLRAKLADLEAQRARIGAVNKAVRKGGLEAARAILTEREYANLERTAQYQPYHQVETRGYPSYVLSNLSGNISRARKRLIALERDAS